MMILRNERGTEIRIGGKVYGTLDTGCMDVPNMVINAIGKTIGQIAKWETPTLNFVFGNGAEHCGVAIIGTKLCAVIDGTDGLSSDVLDYSLLGLEKDAPVEQAMFRLCYEAVSDIKDHAAEWAAVVCSGKAETVRMEYERNILESIHGRTFPFREETFPGGPYAHPCKEGR